MVLIIKIILYNQSDAMITASAGVSGAAGIGRTCRFDWRGREDEASTVPFNDADLIHIGCALIIIAIIIIIIVAGKAFRLRNRRRLRMQLRRRRREGGG